MQSKYPAIVIAPQSPLAFGWGTGQTKATPIAQATFDLLKNEIMSKYSVDVKRIYIMGSFHGRDGDVGFCFSVEFNFCRRITYCRDPPSHPLKNF